MSLQGLGCGGSWTRGGEIDVLDPAGYGAVTIAKAISIVNDGVGVAAIGAATGNGVTIKAGAGDSVHLRGLTIDGLGSGLDATQRVRRIVAAAFDKSASLEPAKTGLVAQRAPAIEVQRTKSKTGRVKTRARLKTGFVTVSQLTSSWRGFSRISRDSWCRRRAW
jgi:hypothetical protein